MRRISSNVGSSRERRSATSLAAMMLLGACTGTAGELGSSWSAASAAPDRVPEAGGGPPSRLPDAAVSRTIDPRRSLVVTELAILERFTFERVMNALATQSGVPGATATTLFQSWWDSQNPGPGSFVGTHCDDQVDPALGTVRNGYPYSCRGPLAEGGEASCDPFAPDSPCAYIPIGLFNRFDLAPADGANCGEHRIVFARASGIATTTERNLIIFEASLPNPHPVQGLAGCRRIVDFWVDLGGEDDIEARADALEQFYFDGVAEVERVIDVDHFGGGPSGSGQIRTNQFLQTDASPRAWSLREFRLRRACSEHGCSSVRIEPDTNKTNPWGGLFDPLSSHPNASAFRAQLVADVPLLALPAIGEFAMPMPDIFDSAQSEASGSTDTNYVARFGTEPSDLHDALSDAAIAAGSTLSPLDLVRRAQALSCAGCHRLSNNADLGGGLTWPPSLGFTHVTERDPEIVDGIERYRISIALEGTFLPHRRAVLEDYLAERPFHVRDAHAPIGGFDTH